MTWFFTADEHYGHSNIIQYCDRPFANVSEMDEGLILRHNSVVGKGDRVVHLGDFTFTRTDNYIWRLNGEHTFIRGSHDYWMNSKYHEIWEKTIDGQHVVGCHYAMRVWPRSHYGAWQVHGHSHGNLGPQGKQYDVGVDNNEFYPVSWDDLCQIMADST